MRLIEQARENLRLGRNIYGEETPSNQKISDEICQQTRTQCEGLLEQHGKTRTGPSWLVFHPWIFMLAAIARMSPRALLEERILNDMVSGAGPVVNITLSHAGRVAAKSWFVNVSVQGVPERLRLYKDHGEIFTPDNSGHALRRANLVDARNYQSVVNFVAERFPLPKAG
ncbi:hypothetical protein HYU45_00025 [Candidatus Daviesbacteria bacterium]|nr:hypothetical protein [Candidatus Daviesbacteria bacterium]